MFFFVNLLLLLLFNSINTSIFFCWQSCCLSSSSGIKRRGKLGYKIFIMYLHICQQPKNSDIFKGHGLAFLGGLWIELQLKGGKPKWGIKPKGGRFKSNTTPCFTFSSFRQLFNITEHVGGSNLAEKTPVSSLLSEKFKLSLLDLLLRSLFFLSK